jgi:hypothetical protein
MCDLNTNQQKTPPPPPQEQHQRDKRSIDSKEQLQTKREAERDITACVQKGKAKGETLTIPGTGKV